MPSGSKKRKAAKKKGNQSNGSTDPSSASNQSHGVDELKIQENKEIDAGELSSPDSQDHRSETNIFPEEEKEENDKGENSSNPPYVKEPRIVIEEENVVKMEREFEIEDKSDKKDESSSENSSNSSSSSSDDESHGNKNSLPVVDIAPVESIPIDTIEEAGELVEENLPVIDSESKKEIEETNSPPDHYVASCVVDESLEDKIVISAPAIETEEEDIVQSVEDTAAVLVEHEKDSGVTEPLLAPDSRAVETTSWKSCCGLFEVFSGSGR